VALVLLDHGGQERTDGPIIGEGVYAECLDDGLVGILQECLARHHAGIVHQDGDGGSAQVGANLVRERVNSLAVGDVARVSNELLSFRNSRNQLLDYSFKVT
jgi:hypothetical protein